MKLKEIKDRICKIRNIAKDDEAAHSEEDDLYHDFIKYIANGGNDNLQVKAREILNTEKITFARWCA